MAQPDAEYYTLLGTALASKTGPDVIWANGGAQAKNLIGGLLSARRQAARPDLHRSVGKSAFTGPDGKLYFIPTTLQGHVVYYNKKLYKDAGLDPDKPPTTWAEVDQDVRRLQGEGRSRLLHDGQQGRL